MASPSGLNIIDPAYLAASGPNPSSSSSSRSPFPNKQPLAYNSNDTPLPISKIHLLPIGELDQKKRMTALKDTLRKLRDTRTTLQLGQTLKTRSEECGEVDFRCVCMEALVGPSFGTVPAESKDTTLEGELEDFLSGTEPTVRTAPSVPPGALAADGPGASALGSHSEGEENVSAKQIWRGSSSSSSSEGVATPPPPRGPEDRKPEVPVASPRVISSGFLTEDTCYFVEGNCIPDPKLARDARSCEKMSGEGAMSGSSSSLIPSLLQNVFKSNYNAEYDGNNPDAGSLEPKRSSEHPRDAGAISSGGDLESPKGEPESGSGSTPGISSAAAPDGGISSAISASSLDANAAAESGTSIKEGFNQLAGWLKSSTQTWASSSLSHNPLSKGAAAGADGQTFQRAPYKRGPVKGEAAETGTGN